jgi:GGDEF domain-containing protein
MAASDPHPHTDRLQSGGGGALTPAVLGERVREEIDRAERHGAGLSCLLLVFDDLDQLVREHGGELREQTIAYVAGALLRELRSFDRVGVTAEGDVLVLLPGADSPRGEIVARRALERLRTIKVESDGRRMPLQVSMGLAAWREGLSAQGLLALARAALRSVNGANGVNGDPSASAPPGPTDGPQAPSSEGPSERPGSSAALGRLGGQ